MTKITIEKIKAGLKAFGVKGKVALKNYGFCVGVYVNGERFGLWDCCKNTFVD